MYQCSLDNLVIKAIGIDDILNSTKEKQEGGGLWETRIPSLIWQRGLDNIN